MKTKLKILAILLLLSTINHPLSTAFAQGTAFTFQGRLTEGGLPANGSYDLKSTLFGGITGDGAVAGPLTNSATVISNGLFTVALDFGNQFDGSPRFLEIAVRTNGVGAFSILTPRQPVTAAPYAITSLTAGSIAGLRITGNLSASPNVIGGASVNYIAPSVVGSTIGGGGATASGVSNSITGDYSVIGGGLNNSVQTIKSTLGGGFNNLIEGDSHFATIAGGAENKIHPGSFYGTIAGGYNNALQSPAYYSVIGGGDNNYITGPNATIPGGENNNAAGQYSFAAGHRAKANHDGAWVWADSTNADFASTALNQFLIRAGGGVGIGKNNPAYPLDVNGIVNATDFYKNGSPFGASLWVNSGGNIYYSGGNVGIGTASPARPLHVESSQATGRFLSTGSGTGSVIELWNNGSGGFPGAINFIRSGVVKGQIMAGDNNMVFTAGGVERMRIYQGGLFGLGAGNVGIGTATPGAKLEIQSDFDAEVLRFGLDPTDYHSISTSFHGSTPSGNYLGFNVEYNSSDTRRVLTLRGDGNVGIGTTNPQDLLHVGSSSIRGTIRVQGSTSLPPTIQLDDLKTGGRAWNIYSGSAASGSFSIFDTTANSSRLTIGTDGTVSVAVLQINGADVAEPFDVSMKDLPKGSVVIIDDQNPGKVKLSEGAYDQRVAGILSGANGVNSGILLKQQGFNDGGENVALSGRVYALADASYGAIKPGDLLTTSDTPGHCMKVTEPARAQGTIIGKAMSSLENGKGMVLVLVSLQ